MVFHHLHQRTALCILLGTIPSTALAADWYVAPNGADTADGTSSAPVATLARARALAGDGDRILLERGGTYRTAAVDVSSGVSVEAYGEGAAPVLTASQPVTFGAAWSENAEVLTGEVSERVIACYVNGKFVRLARYPNEGFLRIDNDDDPDTIVDAELSARPGAEPGRWLGAQVRWRRWSWWWETRTIASHDATDTLGLAEEGRFSDPFSDPGSGYFIDNDLDELDAPGEWFWADGTLYLYPPSSVDPATMVVEVVTTRDQGYVDFDSLPATISSSGSSFRDVAFQRFAGPALELNGPAAIERCTFAEIETTAIRFAWDSQPFTVQDSVFRDVRNIAIQGWASDAGAPGSLIERNLFLRIGTEPGYGGSGSWHAAGVILGQVNQAVVRLNRFVDTGYAGIILGSDGQTVERNVFVRTMETLNDGAAVYTNCNASIIRENIILDTLGDLSTSHPWYPLGHGIWLEFLSEFRDSQVIGNTIYGSNGSGIFLPNNFSCTVSGNHALDSRVAGLDLSVDTNPVQDHQVDGNIFAAVAPTRRIAREENLSEWLLPPYEEAVPVALQYAAAGDYGSMTNTTLIAAASDAGVIRADDTEIESVEDWVGAASWASAEGSSVVRANAILLFNDTEAPAELSPPPGNWSYADGSVVGGAVALEPFESAVLVTSEPVASTPPYVAASGIDWRAAEPTAVPLGSDPASAGGSPGAGGTGGSDPVATSGSSGTEPRAGAAGAGTAPGSGGAGTVTSSGGSNGEAGAPGSRTGGRDGSGGEPGPGSGGGGEGPGAGGAAMAGAGATPANHAGSDGGGRAPNGAGEAGNDEGAGRGSTPAEGNAGAGGGAGLGGDAGEPTDGAEDDGCGCVAAGRSSTKTYWWSMLGLGLLSRCRKNARRRDRQGRRGAR